MWIVCKEQPQKSGNKEKWQEEERGEGLDGEDKWEYVTAPSFLAIYSR